MESTAKKTPNKYYRKRPAWTMKNAAAFTMRDRAATNNDATVLLSIPVFNSLVSPTQSLNDTTWERIMIKLWDSKNIKHIEQVMQTFKTSFTPVQANNIRFYNYFD